MRADPTMVSDLLFFCVAAGTLSFVNAGKQLSVTQSAVSQRIQRLEARLGATLFRRHKTGLRLTSHGELLYSAIRPAFDSIDDALSAVQASVVERPVVISCVPSLAIEWLTTRLLDFYKFHPDISVTIQAELDASLTDSVGRGDFDIAIRYGPEVPEFGTVVFTYPERVFPVIAPALLAEMNADSGRRMTLLHDALPWPNPNGQDAEWNAWITHHGRPVANPTRDVFSNLVQLCYRAAIEGGGLAMGRKLVASRHLKRGILVPLPGAPEIRSLKYYVVTWPGNSSADTQVVLNWLTAQILEDLQQ